MKKVFIILMTFLLVFSFTACNKEEEEPVETSEIEESVEVEETEEKEPEVVEEESEDEELEEEEVEVEIRVNEDFFTAKDLKTLEISEEELENIEIANQTLLRDSSLVLVELHKYIEGSEEPEVYQFIMNLDGEMVSDILANPISVENITADRKILVPIPEEKSNLLGFGYPYRVFYDFYNNQLSPDNVDIKEVLESYDRKSYIAKGFDYNTEEDVIYNQDLVEIYRYEDGEDIEIKSSPFGIYVVKTGDEPEEFLINVNGERLEIEVDTENRDEVNFFGNDDELLLVGSRVPSENKERAYIEYTGRLYDLKNEEYLDINWGNEDFLFYELLPYSVNYLDLIITPSDPEDETKYRYSIINGDISEYENPIPYEILTNYPELRFISPVSENKQAIFRIDEEGKPEKISEEYNYLGSGRVKERNPMPQFYFEDSVFAFNEEANIWYILNSAGERIINGTYEIRMFIPEDGSFYSDYEVFTDEDGEEKLKLNIDDRFFINSKYEKVTDEELQNMVKKAGYLVLQKLESE